MVKLLTILFTLLLSHPVHVSMSSLYEIEGDTLELTVRLYSDDLALDLYRLYDAEGIYKENDHLFIFTGSDTYYQRYMDDYLKVMINGDLTEKMFIDKKILDLETIIRFRISVPAEGIESVGIENKILTGLHDDQVNLFILKTRNKEAGVKFTRDKTEELFSGD